MFDPFARFRRFLPRSLFWRTFFILLLPVLVAQISTTYIFFDRHWERMTDRLADGVAGEIATLRDLLERYGDATDSVLLTDLHQKYAEHMKLKYTFLPNEYRNFKTGGRSNRFEIDATLNRALDRRVQRPYAVVLVRENKLVQVEIQLKNGLLRIDLPQNRLYDSSGFIFILWLNGLALVFFSISILFMRNQIRPIRKLAEAADFFGRGGTMLALKPTGAREVRKATESFLSMATRISRQMHQRTAMLAGVSHDMRTPLTRMRLQLALMDKTPDTEALQGDVAAMEAMIDAYLSFVRDAADEYGQVMDIVPILKRIVDDYARGKQAEITLNAKAGAVRIFVRPIAFERALTNILDNAIRHARPPIVLTVQVDAAANQVLLMVDDAGGGIAPDKRDEVFKPFVRLNQKDKGTGLGLSIAQDVILAHGGRVELAESPSGGLRVVMHLPLGAV